MRYMGPEETTTKTTVEDDCVPSFVLVTAAGPLYGPTAFSEVQFNAIVEAGLRRMVLRDEDHAAAMMGRAILWARAQKEGA